MIRYISIIILIAFSTGSYAQIPEKRVPGSPAKKTVSINPAAAHKADSLKPKRILRQWNLSSDFSEEVSSPIDTVFNLYNRFKAADKFSPFNATLGNYGLPFYQISFFDRITDPDKFLYSSYYPFMHVPENAVFMNTQVPYTELDWSFAGPKETAEQTFKVRHTQNVNRFFNFGLIYDIIFDLGQYSYQRVDDKTFTLYTSYTGVKYKLYFSAGINNLFGLENGGIIDKNDLGKGNTRDVPVKLGGVNKASSNLKNRNILLVQRYTFGGNKVVKTDTVTGKKTGSSGLSGTFSHIFIFESNKRTYSDSYPLSGFYDTANINISRSLTYDSIFSRIIKNTVRFDFTTDESRKFRLGGGVGLRNEIIRYSQSVLAYDTLITDYNSRWNKGNNILLGRLYNSIGKKFRWVATGELFLSGYRAGDFNLNGEITKLFDFKKGQAQWLITGGMTNRQPSFWYENWSSNNFKWQTNMKKEFRIDVGSSFSYPYRNFDLKFNYAILKNYTDFDTTALPSQYTGGISVASLMVRKALKAWKFHLDTDVLIQKSSNEEILDLPLTSIRSAGYIEHQFRFKSTGGKLSTQFGLDLTYHTLYHPYAYMPATGRFYRQSLQETGNYPFLNVFLNFKLKRTRIFLMFDHVNYGIMGGKISNNYEMIPGYPMNTRMFRFGLSWTFYN